MSYSSDLKKRLTLSELRSKCCASAELYAAFLMNGSAVFTSSEKNEIRRINALAQKSGEKSFQRRIFIRIRNTGGLLWGAEIDSPRAADPESILRKDCCCAAFLRGCFLRSGYITSPDRPARADIAFKDERALQICRNALERLEIRYHLSVRNGKKLIYIKNASAVSDFLVRIGAVGAMLEFENSRIIKNYKNEVNRVTNCDNANLDKTVSAAMRQKTLFQKFMKTAAFEALPEQLQEIARLRVEYDSLSLKELGALLTPTLGKSGVAHRLKKIEELAKLAQ